jgi:hypothetical protein
VDGVKKLQEKKRLLKENLPSFVGEDKERNDMWDSYDLEESEKTYFRCQQTLIGVL